MFENVQKNFEEIVMDNQPDKLITLDDFVVQSRLKVYEITKYLGITKSTWYKRLEKPDSFTVGEIKALTEMFNKHIPRNQTLASPLLIFEAIYNSKPVSKSKNENEL